MIISLKLLGFDQSVTGTNPAKSPQSFFWFLEHGNQNQIRKLIIDEKEIDDNVELLKKKKSKVSMKHLSKVSLSKT